MFLFPHKKYVENCIEIQDKESYWKKWITEMSISGSCTKTDGNIKILRNATLDFLDNLM